MSSDSIMPPPVEENERGSTSTSTPPAPQLQFSTVRWATMGVLRLLYRRWTRIAVRLFPEKFSG